MKHIKLVYIVSAALILVGLSGCAEKGKVTGGGWIPSETREGKANFGFKADSCDAYKIKQEWFGIKGKFNYHDKNYGENGVKMQGDVVGAMECVNDGGLLPDECSKCEGGYLVQLDYRSTTPKDRGEGTAWACFYDNGEGANAPDSDEMYISVEDGPFGGYSNNGEVQGNIQAHECDEEEE